MDQLDQAQRLEEMEREAALTRRITGNEVLTGFCRWCDEPTRGAYCSADCRNDHNAYERMKR